jgi:nucleoside-diphosphate-sugar epimerase
LNVLAAARKQRSTVKRLVHVSSAAAGGPSDAQGNPVAIDAEPRRSRTTAAASSPRELYGKWLDKAVVLTRDKCNES